MQVTKGYLSKSCKIVAEGAGLYVTHEENTLRLWLMNDSGKYDLFISKLFTQGISNPCKEGLEWLNDIMYRGV